VAHDFNNLLTAVLGNLELLRKRVPTNPSIDRLIEGAMQGAHRGAALTQRLLAFARRQALEPRPVDLGELVRGMHDLLRRSIGPRVHMELELPSDLPAALADANQIELALLNLAVNGRDAMPDGGTLTIALECAAIGEAQDLAPGRYVRLLVSDTGSGMDGETLQRAIEPFFSTKEVGKGTGARPVDDPRPGATAEGCTAPVQRAGTRHPRRALACRSRTADAAHPSSEPAGGRAPGEAAGRAAVRRRRFPDQPQHRLAARGPRAHGDQGPVGAGRARHSARRQGGRRDDHRLRDARA
jgi:hypothetical protein